MARVNKSKEVRDYMENHPDEGPTEVASALKQYGVTAKFVSNVKTKMKSTGGKRRRRGRRGRPRKTATVTTMAPSTNGATTVESVVAAAAFIKSCGGVSQAKEALRFAEKVVAASL